MILLNAGHPSLEHRVQSCAVGWINTATPEQVKEGCEWYPSSHLECQDLSSAYGVPVEKVCGIVSTLSGNCHWETNLARAQEFVSRGTTGTLKWQLDVCEQIMREEDLGAIPTILRGPKMQDFYTNLLYPDDEHAVTVDRWVARAVGIHESGLNGKYGHEKTVRERIKSAIRDVASDLGWIPNQVQATIWVCARS